MNQSAKHHAAQARTQRFGRIPMNDHNHADQSARIAELERQLLIERGEVEAGKSIVKDLDEEIAQLKRRVQELTAQHGRIAGWLSANIIFDNAEEKAELLATGYGWIDEMRRWSDERAEKAEAALAQVTQERDEARAEVAKQKAQL